LLIIWTAWIIVLII